MITCFLTSSWIKYNFIKPSSFISKNADFLLPDADETQKRSKTENTSHDFNATITFDNPFKLWRQTQVLIFRHFDWRFSKFAFFLVVKIIVCPNSNIKIALLSLLEIQMYQLSFTAARDLCIIEQTEPAFSVNKTHVISVFFLSY